MRHVSANIKVNGSHLIRIIWKVKAIVLTQSVVVAKGQNGKYNAAWNVNVM